MRTSIFKRMRRRLTRASLILQSVVLTGGLVVAPALFAAESRDVQHGGHATPVAMPGWT